MASGPSGETDHDRRRGRSRVDHRGNGVDRQSIPREKSSSRFSQSLNPPSRISLAYRASPWPSHCIVCLFSHVAYFQCIGIISYRVVMLPFVSVPERNLRPFSGVSIVCMHAPRALFYWQSQSEGHIGLGRQHPLYSQEQKPRANTNLNPRSRRTATIVLRAAHPLRATRPNHPRPPVGPRPVPSSLVSFSFSSAGEHLPLGPVDFVDEAARRTDDRRARPQAPVRRHSGTRLRQRGGTA